MTRKQLTERDRKIERAMHLVWDSLRSHLLRNRDSQCRGFHRKCIIEYAELMQLIADLQDEVEK